MLVLIYIIQVVFGVISGYIAANEGDFEHVTTALLFYGATVIAFLGAVVGRFDQFLVVFLIWIVVSYASFEAFRWFYRVHNGDA